MENKEYRDIYEAICRKAALNAQRIGTDLREFPGRMDGRYFDVDRNTLRPVEHIFCWTPSFFTGMALMAAQHTGNLSLVRWVESLYEKYRAKVFDTPADTMHDLGFMYTLYSTLAYRLTGSDTMKELSVRAAEVLAHRFVPNGRYIRAWGRMDDSLPDYIEESLKQNNFFTNSQGLAIVDCMMNLPLLFWAGEATKDKFFTNVAVAHADTTLKNFIREDGSVCHAYRFDEITGEPVEEFNDCGYSVGSHWARGTAWAVYGFALAWRFTGLERYRQAVLKLTGKYLELCAPDGVPVWDFRLPEDKPARHFGSQETWEYWDITDPANRTLNVDSSAAAIMACGMLEFLSKEENESMRQYVQTVARTLAQQYLELDPECPGVLRQQNGNATFASFGDYFAMELYARLLNEPILAW